MFLSLKRIIDERRVSKAALNAVPANSSTRTIFYIKNGTYQEVVTVATNKINVSLIGQSVNGVRLTYNI